jgi:hypothetical protein
METSDVGPKEGRKERKEMVVSVSLATEPQP